MTHSATCVTCHGAGKVEAPPGHFMSGIRYRCEDCEKAGRPAPYTVAWKMCDERSGKGR